MRRVQVIEEVRLTESGDMFTSVAGVANTAEMAKDAVEILLKNAIDNDSLVDGGNYYTGDRYAFNRHVSVIYKRRWAFVFGNSNDVIATLG